MITYYIASIPLWSLGLIFGIASVCWATGPPDGKTNARNSVAYATLWAMFWFLAAKLCS